jgi:hypothetical protein
MAAGIDYGLGTTNVDTATGIRYGVIHQGEILQAWADSSEPYYAPGADEDAEPVAFTYEDQEYAMEQGGDDPDVFVLRSPFYTLARFASPCAPGAAYLTSQDEDGVKGYAPGLEWFEDGQCPLTLYRVSDDVCVYRPTV